MTERRETQSVVVVAHDAAHRAELVATLSTRFHVFDTAPDQLGQRHEWVDATVVVALLDRKATATDGPGLGAIARHPAGTRLVLLTRELGETLLEGWLERLDPDVWLP